MKKNIKCRIYLRKIIWRLFSRFLKNHYFIDTLRLEGFDIGKGTMLFSPDSIIIDHERPWMIHIGEYCKITRGVTILTHDYSRSVLRRKYGEMIGEAGEVVLGNNVFVGVNSILLMGTHIGNNVIIGAGSVVGGRIPDNVVVAGNPARIIKTLDAHYESRTSKQLKEMAIYFRSYKKTFGCYPPPSNCGPFWQLFENRETFDYENDIRLNVSGDDRKEFAKDLRLTKNQFETYEAMIQFIEDSNNTN